MTRSARSEPTLKPFRFTVEQFGRMSDLGLFASGSRLELLGGAITQIMTKNEPHCFAVSKLSASLRLLIEPDWWLSEEKPVILGKFWRPEPDLAVIRGQLDEYQRRFPIAQDIGLLIEVADTSYAKDNEVMKRRYAAAKIPIYWIVNLRQRRIEVYSHPSGRRQLGAYQMSREYGEGLEVPVILDEIEVGRIAVASLLS